MKVNVQRMVGLGGLEPPTSPLSVVRSFQEKLKEYKDKDSKNDEKV